MSPQSEGRKGKPFRPHHWKAEVSETSMELHLVTGESASMLQGFIAMMRNAWIRDQCCLAAKISPQQGTL